MNKELMNVSNWFRERLVTLNGNLAVSGWVGLVYDR